VRKIKYIAYKLQPTAAGNEERGGASRLQLNSSLLCLPMSHSLSGKTRRTQTGAYPEI